MRDWVVVREKWLFFVIVGLDCFIIYWDLFVMVNDYDFIVIDGFLWIFEIVCLGIFVVDLVVIFV